MRSRIPPLDLLTDEVTRGKDADRGRRVCGREVDRERRKCGQLQGAAATGLQGEQERSYSRNPPASLLPCLGCCARATNSLVAVRPHIARRSADHDVFLVHKSGRRGGQEVEPWMGQIRCGEFRRGVIKKGSDVGRRASNAARAAGALMHALARG